MPSQLKSLVLRAPGIYGLSTEGEQVQASPEFAREANNVAYDSAGRLGNRKGFSSTSSKYALTLGSDPITPATANAEDDDALATAQQPSESSTAPGTFPFTMVGGSLPPNAPRFVSATTAGSSDGTKSVTITGTDVTDAVVTETIDLESSATTTNGSQLFKTVTSATISAAPAANVKLGVQASTQLTIAHTGHGRTEGDTVTLSGSSDVTDVDAAKINTSHTIFNVPNDNSYKIVALDSSSGTTAGGGSSVVAKFVGLQGYPDIEQLFQFNNSSGNKLIATATVSSTRKIFKLDSPYTDFEDITGSTSPSGNDWQFVNFNDKVIGARASNTMIAYTGSSNFANISAASGAVPDGNIVHSAFGRLWAQKADTGTGQNIIAYSALLDETHWLTGAGEINVLGNVGAVHHGYDELVAISSFDGYLVAFLKNSIVIYDSPENPGSLAIEQIIQGVGCIARDSVQQVEDDVYFLSDTGIRSLKQVVFTANRVELKEASKIVRKDLVLDMVSGTASKIRASYDQREGQYWIKSPSGNIWVVNNRSLIDTDQPRITKYTNTDWYSFVYFEGDTFLSYKGCIGKYSGYNDIDIATSPPTAKAYTCRWASNYADFDTSRIKILKNVGVTVFGASGQQITLDWDFDQGAVTSSAALTVKGAGSPAEWNVAQWNIDEFSGGIALEKLRTSASRMGRTVSLGISFSSNGSSMSIEQMSLFAKIGREDR
tara:strand:+ start:4048 stop:6195 length:2148 start_codon:yes stop_codon:yes gene_type:complete